MVNYIQIMISLIQHFQGVLFESKRNSPPRKTAKTADFSKYGYF